MLDNQRVYVKRKDFFEKYVFTVTNTKDTFWEATAKKFACAVIETYFASNTIEEILQALTFASANSLEDFKKLDELKNSDNDNINLVLDLPNATKLCVFQCLDAKIKEYKEGFRFLELEKCYDFCADNLIEDANLNFFFKELYDLKKSHAGETMLTGEVCETPSYDDLIYMYNLLDDNLSVDDKNRLLRTEISNKTRHIKRETDITIKNNFEFRKIPFEFALTYGPTRKDRVNHYKISKESFALLSDADKQLIIIDDKETCLQLYLDFKAFVKKAPRHKQDKFRGLCGIICEMQYKGFGLFKKLPDASETDKFFKQKLTLLGYDLKDTYAKTEALIKLVNKNSALEYELGCELTKKVENDLTDKNFDFVGNYMSYDFYSKNDNKSLFLSFAGYPTDESYFRLTKYSFKNENNHVFNIKVGEKVENAEKILQDYGFTKFKNGYTNLKLTISFETKEDIITRITLSLESKYLGNNLY